MTAPKLPLLPADTTQLTFRDLRAYGLACYRQGLEDAAKVCDAIEQGALPDGSGAAGLAWECADAIRAKAKEIT